MRTMLKVSESVHALALAVWLGSLVMAGAVAAQVFPLIRGLDPSMPGHEGFEGEHWLIVAGHVGQMTFNTTDLIQFVCVLLAVLSLIASLGAFGLPMRRYSVLARACALGAAGLLVAYELLVLGPAMQQDLAKYWEAARVGENTLAQAAREAFMARHPVASRTLGLTAMAVAVAIVAQVFSLLASNPKRGSTPATDPGESHDA